MNDVPKSIILYKNCLVHTEYIIMRWHNCKHENCTCIMKVTHKLHTVLGVFYGAIEQIVSEILFCFLVERTQFSQIALVRKQETSST
jgi:hypothetical protein